MGPTSRLYDLRYRWNYPRTHPRRWGLPKGSSHSALRRLQGYGVFTPTTRVLCLLYSILVANNGIGAVKFIRSVRSWAYKTFGSERAVSLVAMATPEVPEGHRPPILNLPDVSVPISTLNLCAGGLC